MWPTNPGELLQWSEALYPSFTMKFSKFFKRCVEIGIDADVRGKKQIEKMLKKEQKRQEKLEGVEKELADHERTWNPYQDCRIINGTDSVDVKRLAVGIDIETPEMLLIDRMREKGEKVDAVLIHHPEGRALADLDKVMDLQVDVLASLGVPVNHSEARARIASGARSTPITSSAPSALRSS